MRVFFVGIALLTAVFELHAQDELEYRMEIGVGAGLVTYVGDFNESIVKHAQPMANVLLRRVINPYMGLKLDVGYGRLKGSSANASTHYPAYALTPYVFDRHLVNASIVYEYNFWPYGTGRDYRGAKRLTPFLLGGVGMTGVFDNSTNVFTAHIPLGMGVKYKLAERVNIALLWAMHFSLSDQLDGVKDPYAVKTSGMFKNTDGYSALMLSLTYSFMPKCRTCNKDD